MTPRDVDALSAVELQAFWRYAEEDVRAQQRALRKAQRK